MEIERGDIMIIGIGKTDADNTNQFKVPIDNYADKLVWYMKNYLDKLQDDMQLFSEKADKKAKIFLKWIIFPNEKEFKRDFQKIESDLGKKSWNIIIHYTRCSVKESRGKPINGALKQTIPG